MNADTRIPQQGARPADPYSRLLPASLAALEPLTAKTATLNKVLDGLAQVGDKTTALRVGQLRQKLATIEPSVTMIGQVKAGKTSLVNAMAGWPDLLPADVNPWTSVVTSLHLDPRLVARETRAQFQFFDRSEWDRLVLHGGRVGEIAGRAGADGEVEKVRRQIAEMQEKSRRRLGRKFELLLGQTHDYGDFDSELIERYVCLGDDFEDDTVASKNHGRFADITKSARLFLHRPALPLPLCIRDTPGVNDTFMVREQITIRAIRDSRICVVVLSAHQALSSVDMALIRLIANIKSREVMIFVNRIDELADPARQVPEIRDSIIATLAAHQGPSDAQIVFGSALWANRALQPDVGPLDADSAAALRNWAVATQDATQKDADHTAMLWRLSGMPALFSALAERITEGPGTEAVDTVARHTRNLANELRASNNIVSMRGQNGPAPAADRQALTAGLEQIRVAGSMTAAAELQKLVADFDARIDSVHTNFLQRATAALIDHLERYGEGDVWKYDPTGLRVLMRSAYQLFAKRLLAASDKALATAASDVTKLYLRANLVRDPGFAIEPPSSPRVPPPVMLGQTIALDLQGNWWSRWWRRRRGYDAFAEEFFALIQAETKPIVAGLKSDHALALRDAALAAFAAFMDEQARALSNLAEQGAMSDRDIAAAFGGTSPQQRQSVVDNALRTLDKIAA